MNKTFAYTSIIMSIAFVVMGALVAFHPNGLYLNLDQNYRYLIGFVLLVYGIFRFYRAYKVIRPNKF
ncbi:MAG: hypothetical protein D6730_22560 [Bacteroidetes bacterium]|nr:MAG: hypothetical protein D6730_22560 [Bacteroidota bacterium]